MLCFGRCEGSRVKHSQVRVMGCRAMDGHVDTSSGCSGQALTDDLKYVQKRGATSWLELCGPKPAPQAACSAVFSFCKKKIKKLNKN